MAGGRDGWMGWLSLGGAIYRAPTVLIISSKMEVALLQYIAIHCNARSGWIGWNKSYFKKLHRLKIVLKLIYFGIGRLSFFFIFQQIPK